MPEWIFGLKEVLATRYVKRMSLSSLTRKTGIARSTLSRISNNQSTGITLRTISKICTALSCHPGDLFRPTVSVLDRDEAKARAIKHLDN